MNILEVKVLLLPNVDRGGACWHDVHVEAAVKGEMLWNVQHNVATAEVVTKTRVKGADGRTLYSLTNKRRRFKTGRLNYLCGLIRTETLQDYHSKKLNVIIKFELYPKDTDMSVNMHLDRAHNLWVIDQ